MKVTENDSWLLLEQVNATDDPATLGHCLHRLVEQAANSYPDKVALVWAHQEVCFQRLNELANRLARVLVGRGVGRGHVVAVALDRSIDLVVALLGVLKAGGAYVPIDIASPVERIRQIMDDADPKVVVTEVDALAALSDWRDAWVRVDEASAVLDGANLDTVVGADDVAYVLYTSGTTGKPKGVEMSHGAVSNYLSSLLREPGCREADRLLAVSTVTFDMAVPEIFLPLLCGATAIIARTQEIRDASLLLGLVKRHGVTFMQATPVTWQMLLDSGWRGEPPISTMMCSGEPLTRRLADRLLATGGALWNPYGPTEVSYSCIGSVGEGDEPITVGHGMANTRLYVLDDDGAPVPCNSPGELYIGGVGAGRGYFRNPELTRSRFVDNPFDHGKMFRTGDLARFVDARRLQLLGRIDSQVKIRGYRVELGDVEAAVASHADVSAAAVVKRHGFLVAYCKRAASDASLRVLQGAEAESSASLDTVLRPWLAERLPDYMMPAFFVEMDAFPVTLHGKIDRRALPDPHRDHRGEPSPAAKPRSELEHCILAIWAVALGHSRASIDDNFFHIGGDSARVLVVQRQLETLLGQPVSPARLFEHYTVRMMAAYLDGAAGTDGPVTPLAHQRRLIVGSPGSDANDGHIAVVSMACRLPGGVTTPGDFWELLELGRDAVAGVPEDRWDADGLYDTNPDASGKAYCRRGGFVDAVGSFDAPFFGMTPREARSMDPAQQMMLETCWEGFERAGYTRNQLLGSRTGVFIGVGSHAASQLQAPTLSDLDGYAITGSAGGTMSGRVSYVLGLEGPALTVDTACSSSLVTTHLACNALRQGECDLAVSGGVSLLLTPALYVEFSRLRGMSRDGSCRAFEADTQGTGWGEGSVAVVLKRLSDARRSGDVVHAVLRGSAVNHGGRSASLTTPSGPAQRRLVQTALAASGLGPGDIDYVEAHGTATRLGDPIEAAALADVFAGSRGPGSTEPLWVGSAKSNLGHTQAASGLVGLVKVVLALRHGVLPPTLHVAEPTPAVDWRAADMAPLREKRPWPPRAGRVRRAGVSAFGLGGTNAHVVVEEAPGVAPEAAEAPAAQPRPLPGAVPVLLSGHSDVALRGQAEKLRRHLVSNPAAPLADVAYSLATTRNHFRQRLVLMAADRTELLRELAAAGTACTGATLGPGEPRLAMLFTGQGSQLLGTGRGLAKHHPVFREALEKIAGHFEGALDRPLLDVIWADANADAEEATLLRRTEYVQPAIFAVQVALSELWHSWGVRPHLILGHSIGEIAAAHVAGVMDLPDACRLVAARGALMQSLPGGGAMASLEADAGEVEAAIQSLDLDGRANIAGYNTPTQTVVSGDGDAVEKLTAHLADKGRKSKKLDVRHAFHSHHMDGILGALEAVAATIRLQRPTLAMVSTLTGKLCEPGELEQPAYWARQARSPVRFSGGIQALIERGVNIFLEIGPRPVLCGMGAACLADGAADSIAWLPSLAPGKEDAAVMQRSLAELHAQHVPISWEAYFGPFGCRRVELPTYAFQRECFRAAPWTEHGAARTLVDAGAEARARARPSDRFQFEIDWHPVDVECNGRPCGKWGLLCPVGEVSWASQLSAALELAGVRLLPIRQLADADKLDGVLCLWGSDADVVRQAHDLTAEALAQLQAAASTGFAAPVVWVTRDAVGIGAGSRPSGLGAGPLWGLMRTARIEHPELRLRLMDLAEGDAAATVDALAAAVTMELEPECAVRQGRVLVPRMQRVREPSMPGNSQRRLRRDGAVLITGGPGEIGRHVARWLVKTHGIDDLVLVSRRGMKAPGAGALVAELAQLGARAAVVAGNVGDADTVQSILDMFGDKRPLRGVVHAAGALDDGVLSALTRRRCDAVLEAKVDGAWHLHRRTRDMDLDLFVLFSSISGVVGNAGQANYAAANAFLDALAHLRRSDGLPATSVAWGLWGGGGMGSKLDDMALARYIQLGLDALDVEDGMGLLDTAVHSGRALTVAAAYDLNRLRSHYADRGATPALFSSLLDRTGVDTCSEAARRGPGVDLRTALDEAPRGEHAAVALRMVRETVAKTLGFTSPAKVDVNLPLQSIGVDSLTAVLTRNRLAALTGLTLPARVVFSHPNLKALSQFLLSQLRDGVAGESPGTAASCAQSCRTPASTASAEPQRLNLTAIRKGCLDASLGFTNWAPAQAPAPPKAVLVTGVTGFVGAFVARELLEQGLATFCLARADGIEHARRRIVSSLERYDLWQPEYGRLLHPVVGDMAQPLLGLGEDAFDDVASRVDAIFQAGGLVDWMRPLDDYMGPNMISTHELLRLASRGLPKALHFVSTVSTVSRYLGYEMSDDDYIYGYATSKWKAERMVMAARWRGAKASIHRIPFVSASASSGHFRRDRGDFLHNLIAGSIEMGRFPSIAARLSIVMPVDYLARTMVAIATQDRDQIGQDFDYTNVNAPTFDSFFSLMVAAGAGGELLPYGTWREQALAYATAHPTSPLARIAVVLDYCTEEHAIDLFTAPPAGGAHVLGGERYPAPAAQVQTVRKYLDRIISAAPKARAPKATVVPVAQETV